MKYCILDNDNQKLYFRSQEIHNAFIDINPGTLIMSKEVYVSLLHNY